MIVPAHARDDVPGDHRTFGRAVIDEGSAPGRLEAQLHLLAGVDQRQRATAQRTGRGVEIDVVRHRIASRD